MAHSTTRTTRRASLYALGEFLSEVDWHFCVALATVGSYHLGREDLSTLLVAGA